MARYSKPRKHFSWSPLQLVHIWQVGCEIVPDIVMADERRFPNEKELRKALKRRHPELFEAYKIKMGKHPSASTLYDRLHKNFYGDLDSSGRSSEHPFNHSNKKSLISEQSAMDFSAPKAVRKSKPFTDDEYILMLGWAAAHNSPELTVKIAKELAR